jgi:hypothetical protein
MPVLGCVLGKIIIRAADIVAEAGRVGKLAGLSTVRPDWAVVARRIREEATAAGTTRSALSGSPARAAGSSVVAPL